MTETGLNKHKTYFLFDFPISGDYLKDKYDAVAIGSPREKNKIFGWIKGCIQVLRRFRKGDIIICWYDFQAVIYWWITRVIFWKRGGVYCINVLLKDKPTLKNRIASKLYKEALLSKDFHASITSVKYGEELNKKLNINCSFYLLHDMCKPEFFFNQEVVLKKGSVFCGGYNGRDWEFLFRLAKVTPNVNYTVIAPRIVFEKYLHNKSKNVDLAYDLSYIDFLKKLCSAELVVLPLDTNAPAGLQVIYQAAVNHKMIITSKTATTVEYITDDRGVLVENNEIESWRILIEYYLLHGSEATRKANNLCSFIMNQCSEDKFYMELHKMVQKFEC